MSIKVKRRYKKLNEDDQQQNNQAQQPTAPATPAPAAPQAQQNPGQQPANNQAQQPDMNAAVNNINKFVGETFKTIVDGVKANFEKACPEVIAISKDQNSPLKDPVKKLEEVYGQLKKAQVDPTKPETVAQAITSYNDFITALTNFATEIAKQSEQQNNQQQPNQQQNNQQVPQNNTQQQTAPAAPAQPQNNNQTPAPDAQQQNVNASYDYNGFGKALHEKLKMKAYEQTMWRQR